LAFSRKHIDTTDKKLVLKYQKTLNGSYVGELFERYGAMVFGVCLKYLKNQEDSKDAVIQIFEKILQDLKRMKVKHFKSWLYMVTKNYCLMQLRKNKPSSTSIEDLEHKLAQPEEETSFTDRELRFKQLEDAIFKLKDQQRKCIELFYLKEMSYQQIESSTEFTLKEVKSNIQNGKRNLRLLIEKEILKQDGVIGNTIVMLFGLMFYKLGTLILDVYEIA